MNKNFEPREEAVNEKPSLRLFVAILLEPSLQSGLTSLLKNLSALDLSVKWLEPGNLHMTLYFLGDISEEDLAEVGDRLAQVGHQAGPFEMVLGGVGGFPNLKKPRVLFAPVTEGFETLRDLAGEISKKLRGRGEKQEDREFNAHVTLGRVKGFKGAKAIQPSLEGKVPPVIGKTQVRSFALVQSKLTPSGPIYTVRRNFNLSGGSKP